MAVSLKPKLPDSTTATPRQSRPGAAAKQRALPAARGAPPAAGEPRNAEAALASVNGTSSFEVARSKREKPGTGLIQAHPALEAAIANLAQQLTPEEVVALGQHPQRLTDAIEHALVSGELVLRSPELSERPAGVAAAHASSTAAGTGERSGITVQRWPVLGSMSDADIQDLAFLVLMEASKSAQEDLKAIMAGVKAINDTKPKPKRREFLSAPLSRKLK